MTHWTLRARLRAAALTLALALSLGGCAAASAPGSESRADSSPASTPQSASSSAAHPSDELVVRFLDVGQADSALVRCGGEAMLIDGGNVADSSLLVSVLRAEGLEKLDVVAATHAHEDHVGGLAGALNACEAGRVLAPVTQYASQAFSNFLKYTAAQGLSVEVPEAGDSFALGEAEVTVLGPVKQYDDTNNTSLVFRIDFGETSFLFTGDMERDAEADLIERWGEDALRADVLKVGHHGSETSTSYPFLRAVMPEIAVISVGRDNSYGHPDEAVLSRLSDANASVYRTDELGDVTVVSDGERLTVTSSRGGGPDEAAPPSSSASSPALSAPEEAGAYIGNLNSKKFHVPTCGSLPDEDNRIYFSTRDAAVSAGYSPCGNCNP